MGHRRRRHSRRCRALRRGGRRRRTFRSLLPPPGWPAGCCIGECPLGDARTSGRQACERGERQEGPGERVDVASVEDGLEMQVAACGPPCGTDAGDGLAGPHLVAGPHGDGFQVVVCGDQPVAVVHLHAVAAAPEVPAGGADPAGISGVDRGAAGRGVVLAQMEVSRPAIDRAGAQAKRRRGHHDFQRSYEVAGGRADGACRQQRKVPGRRCPRVSGGQSPGCHCRAWEAHGRPTVGYDDGRKHAGTHDTRRRAAGRHDAGRTTGSSGFLPGDAAGQKPCTQGQGKDGGDGGPDQSGRACGSSGLPPAPVAAVAAHLAHLTDSRTWRSARCDGGKFHGTIRARAVGTPSALMWISPLRTAHNGV